MYQFFVEPYQINTTDNCVTILGSDVNHIKNVLRMKIGEELSVSNGVDGKEYRCGILAFEEDRVLCELRFVKEENVELPVRVYLFQGLPKSDKMELIIQKAVELGVYEIIPVATKRCVVKLDDKKASAKIARWQGIAEAAAGGFPAASDHDADLLGAHVLHHRGAGQKAAELRVGHFALAEFRHITRLLPQPSPGSPRGSRRPGYRR